jgi:hypothetical protein
MPKLETFFLFLAKYMLKENQHDEINAMIHFGPHEFDDFNLVNFTQYFLLLLDVIFKLKPNQLIKDELKRILLIVFDQGSKYRSESDCEAKRK